MLIKYIRNSSNIPYGCVVADEATGLIGVSLVNTAAKDTFTKKLAVRIAIDNMLRTVVVPNRLVEDFEGNFVPLPYVVLRAVAEMQKRLFIKQNKLNIPQATSAIYNVMTFGEH